MRIRMIDCCCRVLILLTVVAAFPAAAEARNGAPRLHQRWHREAGVVIGVFTAGPWVFLATADDRSTAGSVGTAINQENGQRFQVVTPGSCRYSAIGGGRLLFDCANGLEIYSLATRSLTPVAENPELLHAATTCLNESDESSSCSVGPTGIGADWIEFDMSCRGSCLNASTPPDTYLFQNIVSGAVRSDPANATTYTDLNSPELARPLCAPFRVPQVPDAYVDDQGAEHSELASITLDGSFAIVAGGRYGDTYYLQRCATHLHQRVATLLGLEENANLLLWSIRNETRSKCSAGELDGLFLPDRHPFVLCVPSGVFGNQTRLDYVLSSRTVFVVSQGGQLWETPAPTEPRRSRNE